jgi:hypothetical protein
MRVEYPQDIVLFATYSGVSSLRRIPAKRERLHIAVVSLVVVGGFVLSTTVLPGATAQDHGARLWLQLDPGEYVYSHPDPWLEDSWVYFITYDPNGVYSSTLTVTNRGSANADTSLLIAIPDTTTLDMFDSIQILGGAGGLATYRLSDFDRDDYNPYVHESALADSPIITPYRQYQSGSHGVYPPSGNAIWTTYYVGPIAAKGSTILTIILTLGPDPDDSFKVHFDAYSLVHPASGDQLQYWTPPSHDATIAAEAVALEFIADVVDVSGNNEYIAVGGGTKVYFFKTFTSGDKLQWMADTGLPVLGVALSEDGSYLAAVSQQMPPLGAATHARLSLYRYDSQLVFQEELDINVRRDTRPLDISRDGKYIAVGTAAWVGTKDNCEDELGNPAGGTLYLFENPQLIPGGTYYTYKRFVLGDPDCILTVRFSGNGQYVATGFWWYEGMDVLSVTSVPPLELEATVGNLGGPIYAVAASYGGLHISTGQADRVMLWEFDPPSNSLTELWRTSSGVTPGGHRRQTISDDGQFIFTKQEGSTPAFLLFDSAIPADPNDKNPEWTYSISYPFPEGADLSVSNAKYAVGAEGSNVHLWGDGVATPPGPDPFSYVTTGITTDAAISYSGPISAVTDKGFLYVFDGSIPQLYWRYPP